MPAEWEDELPRLERWLESFGEKLPRQLGEELDRLKAVAKV